MAEAKKNPTAADKRKAADDALEARIAARKKVTAPTVEAAPAQPEVNEAAPFVPDSPKPEKVTKEKKERKPREAVRKPKAEPVTSDNEAGVLIASLREKITSDLTKQHEKAFVELAKSHKAELKKMVTEEAAAERERVAYEAGVKDGKRDAIKGLKAAIKGV